MNLNNASILLTCFGKQSQQHLRSMMLHLNEWNTFGLPIHIYSDLPIPEKWDFVRVHVFVHVVESYWQDNERYGYRNADYWKIRAMVDQPDICFLYLDLDMRIADSRFVEGFELGCRFDICLPLNPRSFVGIDSTIGGDPVKNKPDLYTATAYNMSPIFATSTHRFMTLAWTYLREMEKNPARGPAVMHRAVMQTGIAPYVLAPEWCLSDPIQRERPEDRPIDIIMVHCRGDIMSAFYKELIDGKSKANSP